MSTNHADAFFEILDDLLMRDVALSVHQVLVETSWTYKEWLERNQDATPDVQWTTPVVSLPTGIDRDTVAALVDVLEDLHSLFLSVTNCYAGKMSLAPTVISEAVKSYNAWFPDANRLVTTIREVLEGETCDKD